jgi:hypothetical protein
MYSAGRANASLAAVARQPDDARVDGTSGISGLTLAERGFVLGLALAGAPPAAGARLGDGRGEACRRALEGLASAPAEARAQAVAELAAEVRDPFPPGIDRVHPGWIRRLLEGEATAVVRAVAAGAPPAVARVADEILAGRDDGDGHAGAPLRPPAVEELRRFLLGDLGVVPEPGDGAGPAAQSLLALAPAALLDAVDRRGAALLGLSLHGAPPALVARAAAGVGEPLGSELVAATRGPVAPEERQAARVLAARVGPNQSALGAVRAIGLRAVAREIAAEGGGPEASFDAIFDAILAVAQRLPPAVGDALLAIGAEGAG